MWTSQSLNLGPPDYESGGIILIVPSPHRRHHTPRRLPIQTDRSRHPPTTYIYIQWCPYHGQDSKQIRNSPIKCYCLSFVTHVYLFLQRNIKSGIYAKISSTINTKKQAARSLPILLHRTGGETRTPDTWFWRPVLYQLSYTRKFSGCKGKDFY